MVNTDEQTQTLNISESESESDAKSQAESMSVLVEPSMSQALEPLSVYTPSQEQSQAQATPSIKNAVLECERVFNFLNLKFNLNLNLNDLAVLIQETDGGVLGVYRDSKSRRAWLHTKSDNKNEPIKTITLSSKALKSEPYEVLTHEFAHYLNTILDNYKGNSNNYHTKDFKKRAEQLLLKVSKGIYGFNITETTPEFKVMLNEFKPDKNAFSVFQESEIERQIRIGVLNPDGTPVLNPDGTPVLIPPKTRLIKYVCSCVKPCIIRTARNEEHPLKAVCQYCNQEFKPVESVKPEPKQEPSPSIDALLPFSEKERQQERAIISILNKISRLNV